MPVAGVKIDVSQDGNLVGSGLSDEDGTWLVLVPGAGVYAVHLDETTLPEGVGLAEGTRATLSDVEVTEGKEKVVLVASSSPPLFTAMMTMTMRATAATAIHGNHFFRLSSIECLQIDFMYRLYLCGRAE